MLNEEIKEKINTFKKALDIVCCQPCGIGLLYITNYVAIKDISNEDLRERNKAGWERQSEDIEKLRMAAHDLLKTLEEKINETIPPASNV